MDGHDDVFPWQSKHHRFVFLRAINSLTHKKDGHHENMGLSNYHYVFTDPLLISHAVQPRTKETKDKACLDLRAFMNSVGYMTV